MTTVDISADLGESFGAYRLGDDEAMLEIVTSAHIACGFHAGDPQVMDRTVAACVARGVSVGAQPGFRDLVGFGRRALEMTGREITTDLIYQIGALRGFAAAHGTTVRHVSPHGSLANLAAVRTDHAEAIVDAVVAVDPAMTVVTQPGRLADAARARGLRPAIVGYADRAYRDDGTLVPRSQPGSVLTDPDEVVERVHRMCVDGVVRTVTGRDIELRCDSILVHGDTPGAVGLARRISTALRAAGVVPTALTDSHEEPAGPAPHTGEEL
ncbi:5-oxoprolinase subunit PxpA [Polymorphospora sp. NPDC050346]|uniref:LamB/YcsF family protein n=1 Tax=Polymorphospora sp. NPDC050346 TaxID=3155780 RepID=UPI0033D8D20C